MWDTDGLVRGEDRKDSKAYPKPVLSQGDDCVYPGAGSHCVHPLLPDHGSVLAVGNC